MTVYCDTSLLVPLLAPEAFSETAEQWFAQQPRGALSYSAWTAAEIASALAQKQRSRQIDLAARTRRLALWRGLLKAMTRVTVEAEDFAQVARLVDSGARGLRASDALHLAVVLRRGLRASDALHLAVVLRRGFDLATFDRDLAAAALAEGVTCARPAHALTAQFAWLTDTRVSKDPPWPTPRSPNSTPATTAPPSPRCASCWPTARTLAKCSASCAR